MAMPLRYKAKTPATISGTGTTKWIGSKEIAFAASEGIQEEMRIELLIAWPYLLERRVRLQLAVQAMVTRVESDVIMASIIKYDFRTRRGAEVAETDAWREIAFQMPVGTAPADSPELRAP
jgi:hypothetical protein